MGPRLVQRVDTHDGLAVHPAGVVSAARDTPTPATSGRASNRAIPIDASWIVLPLIAMLSGLAAFALVRSRVVTTRAAAASRPATMTVDTRPAVADVFIDGRRVGATPLVLTVQPGTHLLALRNGEAERRVVFTAAPGAQLAQYLDLKGAEPAAQTARLSITTDPPGAQVAIDGRQRGLSPVVVENLTAAEHGVTVTSTSGSVERRITLEAGATKELVFSLPRSPAAVGGWVSVESPFQVELFDGRRAGRHERHDEGDAAGRTARAGAQERQCRLRVRAQRRCRRRPGCDDCGGGAAGAAQHQRSTVGGCCD